MADKTKPTKHGGARPGSGRFSKAEIEAIKRGDSDAVVARMRGRHTETVKAMREKLAAKEPPRAPAEPKADEKKPMVISPEDVLALIKATERYARERRKTPELNPFQLPQHPPLATPPKKLQMAMDESLNWASTQWAGGILGNVVAEGLLFLGYPYLAELAQRPEYRVISETIATEMTRKWIKLEGTGDEDKTDKIKELTDELDRLEIRDRFKELAIQDSFFGRSHLYLDLGVELDGSKDEELATPVGNGRDTLSRSKVQKKALRRLQCVEAVWVYPTTYNAVNPLSEVSVIMPRCQEASQIKRRPIKPLLVR